MNPHRSSLLIVLALPALAAVILLAPLQSDAQRMARKALVGEEELDAKPYQEDILEDDDWLEDLEEDFEDALEASEDEEEGSGLALQEQRAQSLAAAMVNVGALDADSYQERERATINLMLGDELNARLLYQALDNEIEGIDPLSRDAKQRVRDILQVLRDEPPVQAVLSRITGIEMGRVPEHFGTQARVDDLLTRIPEGLLNDDPRVWAYLYTQIRFDDGRSRVLELMQDAVGDDPVPALLDAIAEHSTRAIDAQTSLLTWLADQARGEDLLTYGLKLMEEQNSQESGETIEALLRSRLATLLTPQALFERFNAAGKDYQLRIFYLNVLELPTDNPVLRQSWIDLDFEALDPRVQQAYMDMACREELHEALENKVGSPSMPKAFYKLLAVIGTPELWQRALAKDVPSAERSAALTWLPFSSIDIAAQVELLWDAYTSEDARIRSIALEMLRSYGTQSMVERIVSQIREEGVGNGRGGLLAAHAWRLPKMIAAPWTEDWFSGLSQRSQVEILRWYDDPAIEPIVELALYSHDKETSLMAVEVFLHRPESVLGCQLRAHAITSNDQDWLSTLGSLTHSRDVLRERMQDALQRLDESDGQWNEFDVQPAELHQEVMHHTITLALLSDEEALQVVAEREFFEDQRELISLLTSASDKQQELAKEIEERPADLLGRAKELIALKRYDVVISALLSMVKDRQFPEWLIEATSIREAVIEAIMSPAGQAQMHDLIFYMARTVNESYSTLPMICLAMNGGPDGSLEALLKVSMNVATPTYQQRLLQAAAASHELTPEWVEAIRKRWLPLDLSPGTEQALRFLDAVTQRDTDALFMEANQETNTFPALCALARSGNRSCLYLLVDAVHRQRAGSEEPLFRAVPSALRNALVDAFDLDAYCDGVPAGITREMTTSFWESTRYTWCFDPEARQYQIASTATREENDE